MVADYSEVGIFINLCKPHAKYVPKRFRLLHGCNHGTYMRFLSRHRFVINSRS